jgi:hypothetical protein
LNSTLIAILTTVISTANGAAWPRHEGRLPLLLTNVSGEVSMIVLGAAALFIGWSRRLFLYHSWIGRTCLWLE